MMGLRMHTVLVADDHPLYRAALADIVGRSPDLALIGAVESLESALTLLAATPDRACDLAVLDLNMPGMEGLAGITRVLQAAPATKIALISGDLRPDAVTAALALGATGFLPKSFDAEVILAAIRLVLTGAIYVPHELAADGPARVAAAETLGGGAEELTVRERAVLDRMVLGETYKEIGRALGIAEITVKLHSRRIAGKLGARNRAAAIATAVRRGIVPPG